MLPQVIYNTSTGVGQVRVQDQQGIHDLKRKCSEVELARLKTIIDDTLPKDVVLFGIKDGIEDHFDFFFAKNSENKLTLTENMITQFGEGIKTDVTGERATYQPIFGRKIVFDLSHLRIYGKIAFNYLAYRKGKEFVLRSSFDPLRKWIAEGGTNDFATLNISGSNPFTTAKIPLPESFHVVHLAKVENFLVGKVFLYGALGVDIVLCDDLTDSFDGECLICDWKKQKEYEVEEYLKLYYSKRL